MQEDMKDFVTSQPAAGAVFTVVLSVPTFRHKIERYAERGGDGGLTRATMRAACGEDVALHPDGGGHGVAPPARRGDRGGEAVSWLVAGRRQGACFVPRVSREALPGEWLGHLVGAPRQHVAPGRVAQGAGQGPCGDPAATEGERVMGGATAERQVRGAVDPAHPHGARGVGTLAACAVRHRTRRSPRKRCRPTLVSPGANASPSPSILSNCTPPATRRRSTGVAV